MSEDGVRAWEMSSCGSHKTTTTATAAADWICSQLYVTLVTRKSVIRPSGVALVDVCWSKRSFALSLSRFHFYVEFFFSPFDKNSSKLILANSCRADVSPQFTVVCSD